MDPRTGEVRIARDPKEAAELAAAGYVPMSESQMARLEELRAEVAQLPPEQREAAWGAAEQAVANRLAELDAARPAPAPSPPKIINRHERRKQATLMRLAARKRNGSGGHHGPACT